MFMTPEQLQQLSGYAKPALQRRWLAANGYRFDVRADGRPAVLVTQVESRQTSRAVRSSDEPNFAALGVTS
jgi:hypothetical protein